MAGDGQRNPRDQHNMTDYAQARRDLRWEVAEDYNFAVHAIGAAPLTTCALAHQRPSTLAGIRARLTATVALHHLPLLLLAQLAPRPSYVGIRRLARLVTSQFTPHV
jgi:hypothetical protein